jgi:DNA-binding GntR family transcriptional regulator
VLSSSRISALIDRMAAINGVIDETIVKGDASGYVRSNLEFHRTLYLRAQAPAMLALIETVWLQAGPTMRMLYERLQRRQASDNHRKIIAALRAGDEPGLRLAIRMDVTQGLRMLVS